MYLVFPGFNMSFHSKRSFSTALLCCEIKAPFKTNVNSKGPVRFDKNFPVYERTKAWDREGMDKDTFFRKKYAHIHVKQKAIRDERRMVREAKLEGKMDSRPTRFQEQPRRIVTDSMYDYVYGTSPVIAALKANKRTHFGTLYVYNPKDKHEEILELLQARGGKHKLVDSRGELFQLAQNKAHNGYVLMCNPLMPLEIRALGKSSAETYSIVKQEVGESVTEECPVSRETAKHPLGIYLDEISDPHNLGAILRSAYFLGADFVVLSDKNCAPLSPVVSKISAGAMEFMPIYTSPKPVDFFERSQENGWNIVSTVAPHAANKNYGNMIKPAHLHHLVADAPTLLVVGSEGEGIRTNLKSRSTHLVELRSPRTDLDESVDSLNVSVATALLLQNLLQ